jgi:hypothetical protein
MSCFSTDRAAKPCVSSRKASALLRSLAKAWLTVTPAFDFTP